MVMITQNLRNMTNLENVYIIIILAEGQLLCILGKIQNLDLVEVLD